MNNNDLHVRSVSYERHELNQMLLLNPAPPSHALTVVAMSKAVKELDTCNS